MSRQHRSYCTALIAALALAGCGSDPAPPPATSAEASAAASAPPAPLPDPEPEPEPAATTSAPAAAPPPPPAPRYAPRDACAAQPAWPAFHKALVAAIRARDADALAALAAPDIALDYGGGSGTAELKRRLADPQRGLWAELAAILPLGCAIEGGLAAMPWVFWNVPPDIDSYSAMLVLGDDTPLLEKSDGKTARPEEAAPVAGGPVGWALVAIDPMDFDARAKTTRVRLEDGRKGWIETARLRSLLDYRLIAESKDGQWRLTAFIAGD